MNPVFLILYVVIVTILIVLLTPRLRDADPRLAMLLWVTGIAGFFVFVAIAFLLP